MDTPEHRDQLLWMAERWDGLAEDRLAMISRHPELGGEDEREEAQTWADRRSRH